jgi:hypothetical protein
MKFYIGTHEPSWLAKTSVPLCVSRRRLIGRKTMPRAVGSWILDSGGFTELSLFGGWSITREVYADEVRRIAAEVGIPDWACIQDWMCEPHVRKQTGKTVEEHQRLTIDSYLGLREIAPEIPWIPVLQGWTLVEYWEHARQYAEEGVDLAREAVVGLGTVCRRQATASAQAIIATLAADGLKLHGFGIKTTAFLSGSDARLASADSLAWSFNATKNPPLQGCKHKHCQNCLLYALEWRANIMDMLERNERYHHADAICRVGADAISSTIQGDLFPQGEGPVA